MFKYFGQKKIKLYGFLFIILFILQVLPIFVYDYYGTIPHGILSEDGYYEYLAAICCLLGSLLFFYTYIIFDKKNYFPLIFSILLFILFAEEISWGQRIFDISTPKHLIEYNYQKEINIHNLKFIQSSNNSTSDIVFKIVVLFLVILPFFRLIRKLNNWIDKYNIPIASIYISIIIIILRFTNKFNYEYIYGTFESIDKYSLGEAYEGNIEILLFILSLEYYLKIKNKTLNMKRMN